MSATGANRQMGNGVRMLLTMACIVVVVTGLKSASELFIPIFLGLFLAILSMPVLNWLTARGFPRPIAILLTIGVDFLVIGGLVFVASGAIPEFQDKRVVYAENMRKLFLDFSENADQQIERFSGFWTHSEEGEEILPPEDLEDQQIPTFRELFNRYWDSTRIVDALGSFDIVSRFTSIASKSFFAFVIMVFLLAESGRYLDKVQGVLRIGGPDLRRFQNSSQDFQRYLGIKTIASAATGVLAGAACSILGVDFAILWGLVAFLFNYVPVIGSIVAGFPPALLMLMERGFWPAMIVVACYFAINIAIGNFIEPMMMGRRFGISTLVVILSVMVWGFIWGPVGMFLAVPLTMMIKVMLENSPDLRWIAVMMGKNVPAPVHHGKLTHPPPDVVDEMVEG